MEDSKNKAEVLSKAAGVTLGDIQIIDYSWGEIDFVTRPMNDIIIKSENIVGEPWLITSPFNRFGRVK